MGQKRLATFADTPEEKAPSASAKGRSASGRKSKVAKAKPVLHLKGTGGVKDMSAEILAEEESRQAKLKKSSVSSATSAPSVSQKAIQRPPRERSRRYRLARSRIDRTKSYSLEEAVELLKKVSIARYDASVEAHLNLTEIGLRVDVTFPHSTGRTTRVAIATDSLLKDVEAGNSLLKDVEAGKIYFDILVASPDMMPKIAKVAKILGPKGLMPNPKAGTVTKDPEKKKKDLEAGQTMVKGEAKAPLMHVVVGKISLKEKELAANIQALITAVGEKKILKLTLASSVSPSIRVELSEATPTNVSPSR
ncbi:MAG: hypothetical protein HYS86_03400 [Candidatus Chisholmbacteria bacterium]|nr:hypothetical protein [Candidatus Chisholmbacteria bacterium]